MEFNPRTLRNFLSAKPNVAESNQNYEFDENSLKVRARENDCKTKATD